MEISVTRTMIAWVFPGDFSMPQFLDNSATVYNRNAVHFTNSVGSYNPSYIQCDLPHILLGRSPSCMYLYYWLWLVFSVLLVDDVHVVGTKSRLYINCLFECNPDYHYIALLILGILDVCFYEGELNTWTEIKIDFFSMSTNSPIPSLDQSLFYVELIVKYCLHLAN